MYCNKLDPSDMRILYTNTVKDYESRTKHYETQVAACSEAPLREY